MAILPHIPGLNVVVVVDGVDAQEYDPDEEEDHDQPLSLINFDHVYNDQQGAIPHVVRYIEAKPGAPFFYRIALGPDFVFRSCHHLGYRLQGDGKNWGGGHVFASDKKQNASIVVTVSKITIGNSKEGYKRMEFCFAPLSLVESDNFKPGDIKAQVEAAKEFGSLKLSFFRFDSGNRYSLEGSGGVADILNQPKEFSEKALKGRAVDCVSSFTSKPLAKRGYGYERNYTHPRKLPFAVFEFRYRSKEGLMAEGIIPRPVQVDDDESVEDRPIAKPEQSTLEQVRGMSDEEVRRRLAELMDQSARGGPGIKREAPMDDAKFSARYKTRKLNNGQVEIDLTDD
ncbi:hypothetical protein QBC44DRAFT_333913 [Cladorrhinum sp. PSN332]|nr:hypothetical protein QBC44DRAFT_333913 [Cladorrhinum sp. PSN332]